jgi:hypothetical protein
MYPFLNCAPHHKDVLGNGVIVPSILNLGTRRRWLVRVTARPLYLLGKSPSYPLASLKKLIWRRNQLNNLIQEEEEEEGGGGGDDVIIFRTSNIYSKKTKCLEC